MEGNNKYVENFFSKEPDEDIDLPYYDDRIQEACISMLEHIASKENIDMKTRKECIRYTYIIASDKKYTSPSQLYRIDFVKTHIALAWKDIQKEWPKYHPNYIWIKYLGENSK